MRVRWTDRLLPDDVRAGFFARFLRFNLKAQMSGNTQGYAAGVEGVRIADGCRNSARFGIVSRCGSAPCP
jgi:hypothetical protein